MLRNEYTKWSITFNFTLFFQWQLQFSDSLQYPSVDFNNFEVKQTISHHIITKEFPLKMLSERKTNVIIV